MGVETLHQLLVVAKLLRVVLTKCPDPLRGNKAVAIRASWFGVFLWFGGAKKKWKKKRWRCDSLIYITKDR